MALSLIKGSRKTDGFGFLTPDVREVCRVKMMKNGNKLINEAIVVYVYFFFDLGNDMVATMKVLVCFIVINYSVCVSDLW